MSMSIGMAQGMNALISINSHLSDMQAQALSGKKVNSAADGLAAFLSAKNYSDRSSRLANVNDTLGTNLQTIKAAQTGLNSIRTTVSDALDTLKAASQTQSFVAATNATKTAKATPSASATSINIGFTVWNAANTQQFTPAQQAITNDTALVAANGNVMRLGNQNLAQGQVFKINGTSIKIGAAADVAGGAGTDAAPTVVTTVGQLLAAMRGAIGSTTLPQIAAYNYNGQNVLLTGGSLGTNAASPNTITFAQTALGTAAAATNINQMFAGTRGYNANAAADYTQDVASGVTATNGLQSYTLTSTDIAVSGGTNGQAADARRAAAAKSFKLAIDQIGQYLKSSSVSGTNLLNGDSLKVTFDEKGTNTSFQLQDAANNALTFTAASLGIVNAATGASPDITANFATNAEANDAQGNAVGLNAAIDKLTNALSTLSLGDSQVAQFQATTNNRVDFNKSIVSLLDDASNSLTAADMSQVAAQTAALQVQQSFAQTILANTKQSDQSIMQLLR